MTCVSPATYHSCLDRLAQKDEKIGQLLSDLGYPPFWSRPKGFAGLARIILEQQVSLASAARTWQRLEDVLGQVTPEKVGALTEDQFKSLGITRQKSGYIRGLALKVRDGLDPEALEGLSDSEVRDRLLAVKGIGPWTADIYLIMGLHRPDVFPSGDLALNKALAALGFTEPDASAEQIRDALKKYAPFRSLLACLLWHWYIVEHRIALPAFPRG